MEAEERAELATLERRLAGSERAPYDGRMADRQEWARSVVRLRERIRELRGHLDRTYGEAA